MEKKLKQIIENNTIYPVTSTNFINPKTSTKCNTMISKCFNNININKIQEKPNNFRNSIVSKTNYVNKNTTLNIDYKSNHSTFDKIESRLNFQYKDGYEEFMNENEIKFKRKNNSVMRSNQNYDHSNIIIREDFKNDYNYHNNYSKITSANDFSYISNKLDKLKDTLNQKLNWSPNNNMLNPSTLATTRTIKTIGTHLDSKITENSFYKQQALNSTTNDSFLRGRGIDYNNLNSMQSFNKNDYNQSPSNYKKKFNRIISPIKQLKNYIDEDSNKKSERNRNKVSLISEIQKNATYTSQFTDNNNYQENQLNESNYQKDISFNKDNSVNAKIKDVYNEVIVPIEKNISETPKTLKSLDKDFNQILGSFTPNTLGPKFNQQYTFEQKEIKKLNTLSLNSYNFPKVIVMNSNTFSNVFYKGETLANRIREDIKNIKSLSKRKKPNPIFDNLYNRSPTVIRYNHVNIFKNVNCPKSHKKIENYTVNNQTFINSSILKMKDVMSKSKDQFKNKRLLSLTSKLKEELDIYQNKKGIKYEEESFFMNNSFSIMKSNNFDDLITKNSEVKLNYIINKK